MRLLLVAVAACASLCHVAAARKSISSDGWGKLPKDTGAPCQCSRVALRDLSSLPKDAPVIATGVTDDWPAQERWKRRELMKRRGQMTVTAASPSEIAGGDAYGIGIRLPLRDYIKKMGDEEMDSLFIFDTNASLTFGHDGGYNEYPPGMKGAATFGGTGALARDFITPQIFKDFLKENGVGWNMLSLGGAEEGLGFHVHGPTWLGIVYGIKEWWLYPPGEMPDAVAAAMMPLHSAKDWTAHMREIFESLPEKDRPIRCVQRAGEGLYLPSNWAHATFNLSPTIGAGGQGSRMQSTMEKYKGGWFANSNAVAKKDFFAHMDAGMLATSQFNNKADFGHYLKAATMQEAVDAYSAAIKLCPRMLRAHAKLLESLIALGAVDTNSETRVLAVAAYDAAATLSLAAIEGGATKRSGAVALHRLASIVLDAVTLHSEAWWDQPDALDRADKTFTTVAELAASGGESSRRLAADAALQRGMIEISRAAGTPGVPPNCVGGPDCSRFHPPTCCSQVVQHWIAAAKHLEVAASTLGTEHVRRGSNMPVGRLLDMALQGSGDVAKKEEI